MYTYDRVDDARVNMEIIRNVWSKVPLLKDVVVVHAYNGNQDWWPEAYLENTLCRTDNPGHFSGAELLLNTGIQVFKEKYPDITHVVVLASDTWCVKPEYIQNVIQEMVSKELYLATNAWGSKKDTNMFKIGMALDLFILDMDFVKKSEFFPLNYKSFGDKYGELLMYRGTFAFLERVFALRFKQALMRIAPIPSENLIEKVALAHLYHMREREPVHYEQKAFFKKPIGKRHMYWPKIGLLTHHDPVEKRRALKEYRLSLGEHGRRFLEARDFKYFNQGKNKTTFVKGAKTIDYND